MLLTQKFDSIEKIRQIRMPVLIVHGTDDRYVPPRLSEALYEAAPPPKKLLLIPNGTHNNSSWTGDADYRLALRELFGPAGPGSTDAGESVVVLRPAGGMTPVNRGLGPGVLEAIGPQR
jgi:dienelactone hydrolase